MAQSGNRAGEEDLSFLLARSVQMGMAAPATGASLTRRNRAAKHLASAHQRVIVARTERDRYRHMSAPSADAAYKSALESFHEVAARALGLEDR